MVSKIMGKYRWIIKFAALRSFLGGCETYFIGATAWYYIKSLGQTKIFLALVLSSFNVGSIIAPPVFGLITDRFGSPKFMFISCCVIKVISYMIYSINLSAYFPLFGRLLCGLADGSVAILLGQVALQTEEESLGGQFVVLEGIYCLGSAFGPGIGSIITFRANVLGWKINDGNSPGIVLTIIWLLFLIVALLLPNDMWVKTGTQNERTISTSSDFDDDSSVDDRRLIKNNIEKEQSIEWDSRIFCLFFLIFSNELFSSTSTFYVPILGLDHFHLQEIHIKLLFLNCMMFTLLLFLAFYIASKCVNERKLLLVAMFMQTIAISFLTLMAFSWNQVSSVQYYFLLIYICFGMPYFAYPLGSSMLSRITDARNASFVQGLSYATVHSGIVISRVLISFVFTKTSLVYYCFALTLFWSVGFIWYGSMYKRLMPGDEKVVGN